MTVSERLEAMRPAEIGVPGPTSTDMARAFRSVRRDPLSFLGQVWERYGDLVSFPVPGAPALLLNDPADVRHVLQTGARHWGKRTVQYAALGRVTGPGLLASSEPNWIVPSGSCSASCSGIFRMPPAGTAASPSANMRSMNSSIRLEVSSGRSWNTPPKKGRRKALMNASEKPRSLR